MGNKVVLIKDSEGWYLACVSAGVSAVTVG